MSTPPTLLSSMALICLVPICIIVQKFHADLCHCRQDICNWTEKKTETNIPFHILIRSVWRVQTVHLSLQEQQSGCRVLGTDAAYVRYCVGSCVSIYGNVLCTLMLCGAECSKCEDL